MKFINKISTIIKLMGAVLILLILTSIMVTLYLNQQNQKDALIINIAGKQRMLTQKIAKNIFYIQHNPSKNFKELNGAIDEFVKGLYTLEYGNQTLGTYAAPTEDIQNQIKKVNELWSKFYKNIQEFITIVAMNEKEKSKELENIIISIENENNILLSNIDNLVTMYTEYSESKTDYMKFFQYLSAFILLSIFVSSLTKLRQIEARVDEFMEYSKSLVLEKEGTKIAPLKVNAESEILEVSDTINCFIDKINSAVTYSNEALEKSQQASLKLEELTDEFDGIIDELRNGPLISKQLSDSENIAIDSTEGLINSTIKLQNLKKELDKIIQSCQPIK